MSGLGRLAAGIFATTAFVAACGGSSSPPPAPSPPVPAPVPATPPAPPLALAVGDGREIDRVEGDVVLSFAEAAEAERYVVVLTSTSLAADAAETKYRVIPGDPTKAATSRPLDGCSVPAATVRPPPPAPVSKSAPLAAGAKKTFAMAGKDGVIDVTATAVVVGEQAVVWADQGSKPPADLAPDFARSFLEDFEATVLPRARQVFGRESDIDGDGRIALLFSAKTAEGSVAFFRPCDLTEEPDCERANRGEVLYLTPPNAIKKPYNTPRAIKEILAHELEHLIHHNQKVLGNNAKGGDRDSAYLLEGFGALAQDVTGFQAGNLYVTKAGFEGVGVMGWGDLLRPGAVYDKERDGSLRGGAYLFVRWLYDRGGGDEVKGVTIEDRGGPTLVRSLLSAADPIPTALAGGAVSTLADVVADFGTTLAFTDAAAASYPVARNPCFSYLAAGDDPHTERPRGVDPRRAFHGQALAGARIDPLAKADGVLRGGGLELLSIDRAAGDPKASFAIQLEGSGEVRVRVVRTR